MVSKCWLIYTSHFLSSWGDRMWHFAVALFLMNLASENLLLPAIYGLTLASAVLLFAPLVGNWIDRSPRLRAVQVSLFTQNSIVALCAIILLVQNVLETQTFGFLLFIKIASITLGAIAQLASVASSIVIQKDWIVVIAEGNEELLANLNSVLRRIDLTTKLLAPIVCGQVMTLGSISSGCLFVAGWNIISMVVEYILLRIVYNRTPALATKMLPSKIEKISKGGAENGTEQKMIEMQTIKNDENANDELVLENGEDQQGDQSTVEFEPLIDEAEAKEGKGTAAVPEEEKDSEKDKSKSCWQIAFSFILILPKGWHLYMSQSVAKAGIGLSCLYMTVLGFDAITVGFAYNQCSSELLVGILVACCGVTGIIATFAFAPLRSRYGLVRTGLMSSVAQILTLIPCVISVFVVGSPFFYLNLTPNVTSVTMPYTTTNIMNIPPTSISFANTSSERQLPNITSDTPLANNSTAVSVVDGIFLKCMKDVAPPASYLSLSLLMTGIILARIGLWGFDLCVTQLFQENVAEHERGIVSSVQSSLNNLMDLLHYIVVIALPEIGHYGFLVMMSSLFVCLGHLSFAIYAKKQTGKICFCH